MKKPAHDEPIRLKVAYKTPESLVGELTKSVGRGGVRIESKRGVAVGTHFVFELHSNGVKRPVEVVGTVASVTESAPGKWVLHIRYEPPKDRVGLDAVIERIFSTGQNDAKRKFPRVPLHLRAVENRPNSPAYRLRDLSLGGVGIDVEGDVLPSHIGLGTPFLMQMRLTTGNLAVSGEVVWAVSTVKDASVPPRIGVAFGDVTPSSMTMLTDLIALRAMPSPPWIARLAFGKDAMKNA